MRPHRSIAAAAMGVAIAGLAACGSTVRVTARTAPGATLAGVTTWNWYPTAALGVHDARVDTSEVAAIIRDAIAAELTAKGYRHDTIAPDILVDFHGKLEQKRVELVVRQYCPGDPEPPLGHEQPYCREYEEGVLTLHVLDGRGERVLWSGEARDEVDFGLAPDARRRRLEEVVREILARLPA